jgi:hypothetical protein
VAALVAACRAEVLSERTIEFYLEGLNSYRAFTGGEERELTLADLNLAVSCPVDNGAHGRPIEQLGSIPPSAGAGSVHLRR